MNRKTRGWPPQRRLRQAENCRRTQPWKKSTGPKTRAGKARMKENPLRHGLRSAEGVEWRRLMAAQRLFIKRVLAARLGPL